MEIPPIRPGPACLAWPCRKPKDLSESDYFKLPPVEASGWLSTYSATSVDEPLLCAHRYEMNSRPLHSSGPQRGRVA